MPRFIPALSGTAVVVVAAVIASAMIFKFPFSLGIGGTTAQPTTTASPNTGLPFTCDQYPTGGTYNVTLGTIRATATVPDGWSGIRNAFRVWNSVCVDNGSVRLEISVVREVYVDACRWRGARVTADTPAAVVTAFVNQAGTEWNGTTDTTLGGFTAKQFDVSVPAAFDTSVCDQGGPLYLWPAAEPGSSPGMRMPMTSGQTAKVYAVDVNGTTLGVVAVGWNGDATAAQIADLDAVVASLRFEPQP